MNQLNWCGTAQHNINIPIVTVCKSGFLFSPKPHQIKNQQRKKKKKNTEETVPELFCLTGKQLILAHQAVKMYKNYWQNKPYISAKLE